MTVRAFIDDSCQQGRVLVLAGYVADLDVWASFSDEWQEMLNLTKMPTFKMAEVGTDPDRLLRAGAFYRIIENHINSCIAVAIDLEGLSEAVAKYNLPDLANPYQHAYRALIDLVAQNQAGLAVDGPIEFIFDKHDSERSITSGFEEFRSFHPAVVDRQYPLPRFEDDRYFLPLQAADLYAWHVRRHWLREGTICKGLPQMSWEKFKPVRYMAFDMGKEKCDETFRVEAEKRALASPYRDIEATITFSLDLSWPKAGDD